MTHGEHWTYDQTTDVGQKMGINWGKLSKWEWYAALNAAYSDFRAVGTLYQIEEDPDFYSAITKAFWCDDDDVHDKSVFNYYFSYVA